MFARGWVSGCLGLLCIALCATAQAQPCPEQVKSYSPLDYETLTVSSTPVALTLAKVQQAAGNASYAQVTVESNPVSIVFTGTPSATIGHQFLAGSSFYVCGLANIKAMKAVRVTNDATLKISYFKSP